MATVECDKSQLDTFVSETNGQKPSSQTDRQAIGVIKENKTFVVRYGKEELLAFYRSGEHHLPEELFEWDDITSLAELKPYSLSPASEIEQRNLNQALSGNGSKSSTQQVYKPTTQRSFTRTITNSSKNFSRPTSFGYNNNLSSFDYSAAESDSPVHSAHSDVFSSSPSEIEPYNTERSTSRLPLPPRASHFSFSSSSTTNSRSFPNNMQSFKKGNSGPPSGPILAGSWRNSGGGNSRLSSTTSRSSQPYTSASYTNSSTTFDNASLPEWLDENPSEVHSAADMTFDNQGKYVPASTLEDTNKIHEEGAYADKPSASLSTCILGALPKPPSQDITTISDVFHTTTAESRTAVFAQPTPVPSQNPSRPAEQSIVSSGKETAIENEGQAFDFESLKNHLDQLENRRQALFSGDASGIDCRTNSSKSILGDYVNEQSFQGSPMLSENVEWYYIDPQKITRGPFSAIQMNKWYSAGYFNPSILIRRSTDLKFSYLGEYVSSFGPTFLFAVLPLRGFSEYMTARTEPLRPPQSFEQVPSLTTTASGTTNCPATECDQIGEPQAERSFVQRPLEGMASDATSISKSVMDVFMRSSEMAPCVSDNNPAYKGNVDDIRSTIHPNLDKAETLHQSIASDSMPADKEEIARRLGFDDPSIMAVSSTMRTQTDDNLTDWQMVGSKQQTAIYKKKSNQNQSIQAMPPTGLGCPTQVSIAFNRDIDPAFGQTNISFIAPESDYLNRNYRAPTLYDLIADKQPQFVQQSANEQSEREKNLAPWSNAFSDERRHGQNTASLKEIMMEEEENRMKQIKVQQALAAQQKLMYSRNQSNNGNSGWNVPSFDAPIESFNKIQLEEMRKSQQPTAASTTYGGLTMNYKPESLIRLRQIQKPQDKQSSMLNWAQWSVPPQQVNYRSQMTNQSVYPHCHRMVDVNLANVAGPPMAHVECSSFPVDNDLMDWAKSEMSAMYGKKVHADAVINLLCKFNTPNEMESFIRQSLGTHSKAAQFAATFHKRLIESEQRAGRIQESTENNKLTTSNNLIKNLSQIDQSSYVQSIQTTPTIDPLQMTDYRHLAVDGGESGSATTTTTTTLLTGSPLSIQKKRNRRRTNK